MSRPITKEIEFLITVYFFRTSSPEPDDSTVTFTMFKERLTTVFHKTFQRVE